MYVASFFIEMCQIRKYKFEDFQATNTLSKTLHVSILSILKVRAW